MKSKTIIIALIGGLVFTVFVNCITIWSLFRLKSNAYEVVFSAREGLLNLTDDAISVDVYIDQVFPIDTEVTIDRDVVIEIDTTIPIDALLQTNIDLPLVGLRSIAIPIRENIPIKKALKIPISMIVPVSTEYHLQEMIPISIRFENDTVDALIKALTNIERALE